MDNREQQEPNGDDDAYRKLIKSMIRVAIIMACAALLLALGRCARKDAAPSDASRVGQLVWARS
jgi:hypothetical protein